MIIINLFGAPSAGKSTCASFLFTELKVARINVELVTEFAKEKTWEGNFLALDNQAYVFGEQFYRISRLEQKVDVIITDSPLPNSILYNRSERLGKSFNDTVMNVFNSYENYNFFLERATRYDPHGRSQNEQESDALSIKLKNLLADNGVDYVSYPGNQLGYKIIAGEILKICKDKGFYKPEEVEDF